MAERSAWEWRRRPTRGETLTQRWGTSTRAPWFQEGRQIVVVPRHFRTVGRATYSERSALPVRGGWYAREVRRAAIDHARRVGGSVRKTAEWLRSPLGRRGRRLLGRPLDGPPPGRGRCRPGPGTVALARPSGPEGRGERAGPVGGGAGLGPTGDRRAVGAAAREDQEGGGAARRERERADPAAGRGGRSSSGPRRRARL